MKPAAFEFHAPRRRDELLELLGRYGEEARILAGGQSLVPLMNMRVVQPRVLISLNECRELAYLELADGHLVCGALTRQIEAEEWPGLALACPLLAEALPLVGGTANRNRGTICGSLAHADPLAELPAVAVALDAEMVIAGTAGRRRVRAAEFFLGELTTALAPGELLEAVRFPATPPGARAAFAEIANRTHGFAVVGVAAQLELAPEGGCRAARLAAIGVGPVPQRLTEAEAVAAGGVIDAALLRRVAEAASAAVEPLGSFHADAAYRRQATGVLAARAVEAAWRGKGTGEGGRGR